MVRGTLTALSAPTDIFGNIAEAYGYDGRWTETHWFPRLARKPIEERRQISEEFLSQLWQEIDAGRPVLLGATHGECGRWRVVAGCDKDAGKICYMGGETPYEWTDLIDSKVEELGFWDSQVVGTVPPEFCGGWLANAAFLLGPKAEGFQLCSR